MVHENLKIYKCNKCGKFVFRSSNKTKIKSFCDESECHATIVVAEITDDLIPFLCDLYLKNQFVLSSFNDRQIELLKTAFNQGCRVMNNTILNQKMK